VKQKKRVVSHRRIEMATSKKIDVVTVAAVMLLLLLVATVESASARSSIHGAAIQHRAAVHPHWIPLSSCSYKMLQRPLLFTHF
jgi:hypothetical protein